MAEEIEEAVKYPAQGAGYLTLAAFAKYPRKRGCLVHCSREKMKVDIIRLFSVNIRFFNENVWEIIIDIQLLNLQYCIIMEQ